MFDPYTTKRTSNNERGADIGWGAGGPYDAYPQDMTV